MVVRYSKHHGLGNDFLVTLGDALPLDAVDRAIALCDRRLGIGADGMIFGIAQIDGSVAMRLLNSDGSWIDAKVDASTGTDLENAILARARELRIASVQ